MKTLFLRLNYCALAVFLCSGSVCLGADTVASVIAPAVTSAPAAPQTAPSAADLQAVDAQRSERHKKSEALAAKLIEQLGSSLNAVKAAKDKADADRASAQAVVATAPAVVAATAAIPVAPVAQ